MLKIRPMELRDVPDVLSIQNASPGAASWAKNDYENVSASQFQVHVAADPNGVCGFVIARCAARELEILNIAVAEASRRKGIGSALLEAVFEHSRAQSATTAFLEVRASNSAATEFYACHGFQITGRRRNYYQSPTEDALLLSRPL
jgi:ribosomal-protein-alanine N-acetyltransferase